tara:strand:+ start:718 stop:1023 length:306 start_codon:yes stop_codon:yes gene_type:complete
MTSTQFVMKMFIDNVDTDKEYTRSELSKLLTMVYYQINSVKKNKKTKKEDNNDNVPKKKREPTAYNLFVKEKMPIIKEEFPDLSRQDLMRKVGEMWKAQKE